MPSNYAHYRFGVAMLSAMPADLRRSATRFRQLYDMGLHGPDIFTYCTPVPGRKTAALSNRFHNQTGAEFFGRVCRGLRLEPTEAGCAYLYGLLCHYCLDSVCHDFLAGQAADGGFSIGEAQTEFDRFLLESDGKTPACAQDMSPHMRLTAGESETVARFYPGARDFDVRDGVRNMALITRLLAGNSRPLLQKALRIAPGKAEAMVMTAQPNARCAHLNEPLLALYQEAAELFPKLLLQLNAHLTYNAPLGEDFSRTFRG